MSNGILTFSLRLWIMGRKPTIPEGATSVSAKLPLSLQLGVHQLILDSWRKSGHKPSQNEIFVEALREYLVNAGVDMNQIEKDTEKIAPKQNVPVRITKFPRRKV